MEKARRILIMAAVAIVLGLCGAAAGELPGPIAHWEFDEGGGAIAYDSAGGNDGTIYGAEWVDGFIGGALDFDGANDYVEAVSSEELKLNLAGSVSVWVNPRDLYRRSFVSKRGSLEPGIKYENYFLSFGSSNQCVISIGDGVNYAYATIPEEDLAINMWQHIAGTWDASAIKIYHDSRLIDEQPNTLSDLVRSDACPLRIGYHHTDGWYFDGVIDDVRIYDVALSGAEVEELYGQSGGGLIAHWTFDEGSGGIAYDSAGGNDGVVYGAEWVDGVLGGALDFDGVDDYVGVADDDRLTPASALTISSWVYINQISWDDRTAIVCKYYYGDRGYYLLLGANLDPDLSTVGMAVAGSPTASGYVTQGTTPLQPGQWYHVATTYEPDHMEVYVNGAEEVDNIDTAIPDSIYNNSQPLYIGYDTDKDAYFDGVIDDVRLYGRVLSAGEVLGLFEAVPHPESEVYHVDGVGGSDLNDGVSEATAFATVQKGIDSCIDGGGVVVWPGVYSEAINFLGKAITVESGGDAAVIEASGQDAVTFHSGEGAGSVLKNFVIRNSGLGISVNYGSSPTISNLTIVDNDYGIAAYEDSNPDISNCILWDNRDGDLWGCQARYSFVEQEIETGPVDGLIAQWKFDEGSGMVAGDSAGDNDGAINGAQWVIGQIGGALSFDGADDYISIPKADVFDFNDGDVSISMWFKTSVYANQTLMKFRQYDEDPLLEVYTSTVFGNVGSRAMPGGAIAAYNAGRIDDGDWHHVAASLDNGVTGGYMLYLDGTLVATATFSDRFSSWDGIAIGNDADGGGYFNGSIDDVRVYGRAISSLEAYLLYEMSRGGPVAHWKFDEGAGLIAYDSAGSNDGVVYGAQWATGQIGGALDFDGASGYVEAASSDELKLNLAGAVSVWMKPRDLYQHTIVIKRGDSGVGDDIMNYWLVLGGGTGCRLILGEGEGLSSGGAAIPEADLSLDAWQHVVGTWNSKEIAIYLNGDIKDVQTNALTMLARSDSYPLRIGYDNLLYWHFDGLMDDVRIYDRGLSAGEVELLFDGGLSGVDDVDTLQPQFANAGAGDYHLLSERGRYWPEHEVWVLDKVSSPCIDGGDPAIEPSREPMPNGGALNMGAYGGTEYASMSEWPILSDYDRNGRSDFRDFAVFCDEWLLELPWVGGGS